LPRTKPGRTAWDDSSRKWEARCLAAPRDLGGWALDGLL
jgi:hypothetical protein